MNPDEGQLLTPLQREVARLFFGLEESDGFLIAGGAALIAQQLTQRPTHDLDFFSAPRRDGIGSARDAFERAARGAGWEVVRIHDADSFARLIVTGDGEQVIVDLAIDVAPDRPTVDTDIGPSFAPEELAGRKTIALFDRAEARDFVDVYRLARQFGETLLLDGAVEIDAGFDLRVFVSMLGSHARFADDEFPIPANEVGALRKFFDTWARRISEHRAR